MIDSGSELTRRGFLGTVGALVVLAACTSKGGDAARQSTPSTTAKAGTGTTGWAGTTLSTTPDANGLLLPAGFTSRVVATTGQPVAGTDYIWPPAPDGAATFADPKVKGGWYHAVNAETGSPLGGGVSAIRFDPDGEVVDAYRLLGGTNINCAGGATPWDTWLTCEEFEQGQVWECDPMTPDSGKAVPALGRFSHEAVGVDAQDRHLYLTEDRPDGLFYRFTPTKWRDLSAGVLEAAVVDADGAVTWRKVPDPTAAQAPIRTQGFGATPFAGGEGIAIGDTPDGRRVWFKAALPNIRSGTVVASYGPDPVARPD